MLKMRFIALASTIGLVSVSGSALAQDAGAVIADASKAMGVETLNTVEYSATGLDFVFGQA